MDEAARRIDATPGQLLALVEAGLVPTWTGSRVQGSNRHRFRPSDLSGFLDALRARIEAAPPGGLPLEGIEAAARRACRPPVAVAALVLSGGLERLGNRGKRSGYRTVLVDPEEVRAAFSAEEEDLPLAAVRDATGIAHHVLAALVRSGLLTGRSSRHPMNGTTRILVAPADLERFRAAYVPLSALAADRRVPPLLMKVRLDTAEVAPALNSTVAKVVIYRRADLPNLDTLDLTPWPSGKRRPVPRCRSSIGRRIGRRSADNPAEGADIRPSCFGRLSTPITMKLPVWRTAPTSASPASMGRCVSIGLR